MKKTQIQRVIGKLLKDGYITRNECLKNYITRLSAIIQDLEVDGWGFNAEFIKTAKGKDYIYRVTNCPLQKVVYTLYDGREVIRYK